MAQLGVGLVVVAAHKPFKFQLHTPPLFPSIPTFNTKLFPPTPPPSHRSLSLLRSRSPNYCKFNNSGMSTNANTLLLTKELLVTHASFNLGLTFYQTPCLQNFKHPMYCHFAFSFFWGTL